ncbi:MAG: orotidine 5-phosphate decarboxylase [Pseudomonadota bacterium]|jgi:orotidine-5'-phosphate decarboxylase
MPSPADIKDRLIVALDVPTIDEARGLVTRLGDSVTFYKVGLELVMQGGLDFAQELKAEGKRVFLDMKFLDIPNTVERAVAAAARIGVDLLTIHGHDTKTLHAASVGRTGSDLKILAVTVLTSLDQHDLEEQGIALEPASLVLKRARLTSEAGIDGVVASGQEARSIREALPAPFLLVTPGIRLPGSDAGDQTRIATPESAIAAGADHIVVGRPITAADDPPTMACRFLDHIEAALR